MADLEFYRLSMSGAEADSGIRTGMEAGAAGGVLFSDGNGGIRAATPGTDFGYPLLKDYGVPTNNTAANIGQHYFDMAATAFPYEYICVGYTANGFVWKVYGDTSDNFIILGYFATLEDLEAAVSGGIIDAPTAGAAYGIGTAAPYDIYVWDGVNEEWVNNGPIGSSGGGSGVPPHGDTGQVLTKLSDADGDAGWKDVVARAKVEPDAPSSPDAGDFWFDLDETNEFTVDNAATQGSNNLVTSGGVATAIDTKISMVKLWENASPESAFASQTIALDLSVYDFVLITTSHTTVIAAIGGQVDAAISDPTNGHFYYFVRRINVNPNYVEFKDNVSQTISSGSVSDKNVSNGVNRPYGIYGIKGVRSCVEY